MGTPFLSCTSRAEVTVGMDEGVPPPPPLPMGTDNPSLPWEWIEIDRASPMPPIPSWELGGVRGLRNV